MKVLETYVAEYQGDLDPVGSDFTQILKYLLNMMSDNRLANGCSDLYLMILHHEGSNFNSLASFTFKPSSFFQKKYMKSYKHMIPRFHLIQTILMKFNEYESDGRTKASTFPFQHLYDRLHEALESPNSEMRSLAMDIVLMMS